jgi:uncharacterized phiE125 gp8 family phage protein
MLATLLTGPAIEPLGLAELKLHLRLTSTDEDALLTTLLRTARDWIERETGLALIDQTWRLTLDAWPLFNVIAVPLRPFRSLVAARILDANAVATSLSAGLFDAVPAAGKLLLRQRPADPGRPVAGIEIDVLAGFGSTAASVPQPLIAAMQMLCAYWFENRGDAAALSTWPEAVPRLVAPFRKRRLVP